MRLIIDLSDPDEKGKEARDLAMDALARAGYNPYRTAYTPGESMSPHAPIVLDRPCSVEGCGARPLSRDAARVFMEQARYVECPNGHVLGIDLVEVHETAQGERSV